MNWRAHLRGVERSLNSLTLTMVRKVVSVMSRYNHCTSVDMPHFNEFLIAGFCMKVKNHPVGKGGTSSGIQYELWRDRDVPTRWATVPVDADPTNPIEDGRLVDHRRHSRADHDRVLPQARQCSDRPYHPGRDNLYVLDGRVTPICGRQIAKELPHPQDDAAFGFLIAK